MIRPVPKVVYKRRKPTRKQRGQFDKKTRDAILERDNYSCRVCSRPAQQIHHVLPKGFDSRGRGVFTNGLSLCSHCHNEIHADNEKMKHWQRQFEIMYGKDYFRDRWDFE